MKTKYNRWLSVFLAVLMLFTSVPINTFSINGQTSSEVSSESSTEISSEESTSSEIISSKSEISSTESSEIISSEEDLSTENISSENTSTEPIADENAIAQIDVDGDDVAETDNWELSLIYFDSTIGNGTTPLTEINWDATDDGYDYGTPRVITVQINYKNTNTVTTYEPGELGISIPNLVFGKNPSHYFTGSPGLSHEESPLWEMTIAAGANYGTHTGEKWNIVESTWGGLDDTQKLFFFTNAVTFSEGSNFEGSIQIQYTITPKTEKDKYKNPELEDTCTHTWDDNLQATLYYFGEENCIATSPNYPYNYPTNMTEDTHFWEYTEEGSESITFYFDPASEIDTYNYLRFYDKDGNKIYEFQQVGDDDLTGNSYTIPGDYVKITIQSDSSCKGKFRIFNDNIELLKSNSIPFHYTRTYHHPWNRKSFTIDKTATKINSLDNLPAGDYYWVKYKFDLYVNGQRNGASGTQYPNMGISASYFTDIFPQECIVYDDSLTQLYSEDGVYNIQGFSSNGRYLIVGYPKDIYNEEANNLTITNHVNLYIKYSDSEEFTYADDDQITINLANFDFIYEGELYAIDKVNEHNFSYDSVKVYYQSLIGADTNIGSKGVLDFTLRPTAIYSGYPMDIRIGDDLLYITDSTGSHRKLNENEYYFSAASFPATLTNGHGVKMPADKYDVELWVKYGTNSTYELYETFKNPNTNKWITYEFTKEQHVTAFYFEIKGLTESIIPPSSYSGYEKGIRAEITINNASNLSETGNIYNFGYIKAYINGILQNEPTLDSYVNMITKDEIATFDQNTYGTYVQRDCDYVNYTSFELPLVKNEIIIDKSFGAVTQNATQENFTGSAHISIGAPQFDWTEYEIENYFHTIKDEEKVKGWEMYDLLPKGMELTSTASQIKNSCYNAAVNHFNTYIFALDSTGTAMTTNAFFSMIKSSTSVEIVENYNNTGRTLIHITIDISDNPIIFYYETTEPHGVRDSVIRYTYNYKISYESYLEHGSVWTNNVYGTFYNQPMNDNFTIHSWDRDYWTYDRGTEDPDAIDINNNNNTTEQLAFKKATTTISAVISTHQDITKYVKTDKSDDYTLGITEASPDTDYEYKLRVTTGSSNVTNLIIYDALENAYGNKSHWQGEFLGIDTSYAQKKGYNVKPYYSENPNAGNLYNDDGSLNSDWHEYIEHQEEVTGNGLAITFSNDFELFDSSDYVALYYYYNNELYRTDSYKETSLAGVTLEVPSTDVYIYWYSSSYGSNSYGFKISNIELTTVNNTIGSVYSYSLPSITPTEISGSTYPETTHNPYVYGETIMWHYDGTSLYKEYEEGTNPSLVKALAFEYLDNDGNAAILPANSLTYVLIKMHTPSNQSSSYAYNNCRTEWNALDSFGQIVDGIVGINSNTTRVITNGYFSITVDKIWIDSNNQHNYRPNSVDIILLKDGIEIERKQITPDNLSVTFDQLSSADANSYSIDEEDIPLYTSSISFNEETGHYDIINTLIDDILRSIAGTKSWVNDTEDARPESITIKLLQNGTQIATTTTNAENNWEYSFENIYRYKTDGSEYIYTVEELPVDGYFASYPSNTFDIINTKNAIILSGTKTWVNDTPEQRPESITIKLLQDGTQVATTTTSAENNWEYSFGEYPKYNSNGTLHIYSVEEVPVDRYIASYPSNYGLAITFNEESETEDVYYDYLEIYYILDGTTYKLGQYGGYLGGSTINVPTTDFYLFWRTDGSVSDYYGFTIDSITKIENVAHTGTEATLPEYNVEELTGSNYPDSEFDDYTHYDYGDGVRKIWHYTGESGGGLNIVNTRNSTSISGYKTWLNDEESQRPTSITIKLLQDGVEYTTTTTTANNNWEYTFSDIPQYRTDGTKYNYSVQESTVAGYATSYGFENNGIAINFNSSSESESVSYDYLEIYYVLNGTTYKLGRYGGTQLSGLTVHVPTKDFYLYWHTDESASEYYGFTIDSIEFVNISNVVGTEVDGLPEYTAEELSGSNYPDSEFDDYTHGNYGDAVDKLWHYTFTEQVAFNTPTVNAFVIINTKTKASTFAIAFTKSIFNRSNSEATVEDFNKLALDINDTFKFKISLRNIDTGAVYQGILNSTTGLKFSGLEIGAYEIYEADSNFFDLRSMLKGNTPEGVVLSEINDVYTLIVTKDISDNTVVELKVINILEPDRFFENETYKENLFLINKNELNHDVPQD